MKESALQSQFGKEFERIYPDGWWLKLYDVPKASGLRFIPSKPFDCIAFLRGAAFAIEFKIERGVIFKTDSIRKSQINGLRKAKDRGMLAAVVVWFKRVEKIAVLDLEWCLDREGFSHIDATSFETSPVWPVRSVIESMVDGLGQTKERADFDALRSACRVSGGTISTELFNKASKEWSEVLSSQALDYRNELTLEAKFSMLKFRALTGGPDLIDVKHGRELLSLITNSRKI